MRRSIMVLVVLAAAIAIAQNVNYQPDPDWQPPAEAAARPNPLAERPQLAAGGAKLFRRECSECHGEDGSGRKKNAADLQLPVVQQQSDGALFWKITNGNQGHGMPSFSSLPEMQRWQIVLHVRMLGKQDGGGAQRPD